MINLISARQRHGMSRSAGLLLLLVTLVSGLAFAPSAAAVAVEMETQGRIEQVRIAADQLVVDGRSYQVPTGVQVSIGGTYGAFTLLEPGMRVYLRFMRQDDGLRVLVEVRELAANQRVEQS